MFSVSINCKKLLATITKLNSGLTEAIDKSLTECARILIEEESARTKGQLSKSFITWRVGKLSQIISNTKPYAKYIEYGRGPVHAINAKALRFFINGNVMFRKSVGPAKAQPFVKDSIKAARPEFKRIFAKNFHELLK